MNNINGRGQVKEILCGLNLIVLYPKNWAKQPPNSTPYSETLTQNDMTPKLTNINP